MTKFKNKRAAGFTVIELMMVVTILSVLASIVSPRFDLFTQRAYQSTTKANLGAIRSTLNIYYTDMEGKFPLNGAPDGYADLNNLSLSMALTPKYIGVLPTPKLTERLGSFNGIDLDYDTEARNFMASRPLVQDIVVLRGPAGPTPFLDRPFVYDPDTGILYLCNGNYDFTGQQRFYQW